MKTFTLIIAACCIFSAAHAQLKRVAPSSRVENQMLPAPVAIDDYTRYNQPVNDIVYSKMTLDEIIGESMVYDQQTNATMPNRMYLWPDGSLSASWMMSNVAGYADRGTGYNFSNGSVWGDPPGERLESVKSGWPTLNRWMGNGELVISHRTTVNLVMNKRAVKGTGTWTEAMAPASPAGNAPLVWPAVITNGNNYQNIHILCVTRKVANGGTIYKGLDGALLYYRSLDGGTTWDNSGIQFPGLDSSNYNGFSGDSYTWVEPHGDTIAFICGGHWVDTFLMKSYDNGNTWTKVPILPNYYCKNPDNQVTPRFICSDGSFAGAMDKNGVFHIAFGRMRAIDGPDGQQYAPGTDGLVYWNSTMPVLDTAIVSDLDTLMAHNLCIGYVASNQAGDTIIGFPYYGVSLSSFPQITIDQYNNIYFLWSSVTVGNPSPDPYNYRHIWGRAWFNGKPAWSEMVDFNSGVLYMFQEYVYPAMAKGMKNNNLLLLSQTSSQPGTSVGATGTAPPVPVHAVNFEYREIPAAGFIAAGNTGSKTLLGNWVSQNFPNPVKGSTMFRINLENAATVVISIFNLMGQEVMTINRGVMKPGNHEINIDAGSFTGGVYFYTVKTGGKQFTHKMIVE